MGINKHKQSVVCSLPENSLGLSKYLDLWSVDKRVCQRHHHARRIIKLIYKYMANKRCVIYMRVSKSDESQTPENQKEPLKKMAESLGLEIVGEYTDMASGGSGNRPKFQQMLADARERKFDVILVWSLDRFSREGISNTLHYLEELAKSRVVLKSLQECWLDTSDGMGQLLIAIFSWIAKQEREKISERTKAGLIRAKTNGSILGRRIGSKDKGRRKRSGYFLRWQREKVLV